jgi:hypothetical protein
MAAAATPVGRERGWGLTVLALVSCLAVAAVPFWPPAAGLAAGLVRALVPVEQTLLLVVPALAACALVAWWAGGRLVTAVAWCVLSAWVLGQPLPVESPGYAGLARGWALLLAASFGLVCFVGPRLSFFVRALGALGIACGVALVTMLVTGRDPARLVDVMHAELARRTHASLDGWQRHAQTAAAWRAVSDRAPEIAARAGASADRLRELPARTALLVPALLGLESLAALALAWAMHHRLSRVRLGAPIGSLKSFRFNDQLVWGLVAGVTIVILPSLAPVRAVGLNLLLFFGALYALRGFGILRWLASERVALAAVVGLVLLLPIVGVELLAGTLSGVALAIGLGDTWGDWRNRRARQLS